MIEKTYTQRYYASYDKQKGHITGWYDIKELSHTNNVPPENDLIKLTDDEWNNRKPVGHSVRNGRIVEQAQVIEISLIDQAKIDLSSARTFVQNNFILLGEKPSQEWIDYQKVLIAYIAQDEAVGALPVAPVSLHTN